MFSFQDYISAIAYITLSQLLHFLWQTWPLILASSAIVLLLFAIAGMIILGPWRNGRRA